VTYFPYQNSTNHNTKLTGTVEYQHKQEQSSGDVDRKLTCLCETTNKSTMRKFKTLKPASQISIQHPTWDPCYVNSPNHCLKSSNPYWQCRAVLQPSLSSWTTWRYHQES